MSLAAYYLILVGNTAVCWPCISRDNRTWRITWLCLGLSIASFPWWLPIKVAFYYGLLTNMTIFFWSSDTYMLKGARRLRGIVGGILLGPLPLIVESLKESWAMTLLVPTFGHLVVSGASWPIVVRILAKAAEVNSNSISRRDGPR